ncbi:DUF1636 domain-containing protein [Roseovarius sp. ZX-A-9]|uniref:DUF1636 domain-containing protein n=1 Tax=Roseovarius sp. ZX-A-9 TaxID=3014783 RepID=UPI0023306FE9|nr:DUF1636 domain-containing protein [Roseovarius sp. ZX-A-9]MDX1785848.1 DUF1636 domain-containing protein [Roseovarius sp.]
MTHRIVICSTCDGADGKAFAAAVRDALAAAGLEYDVGDWDCMSNCARPLSVAFRATGKATYLFGDVVPATDLADLTAFARMYAASPDGWIEDARGAGRLRHCLVGRVPA